MVNTYNKTKSFYLEKGKTMKWQDVEIGYWKLGETDSVLVYFKKIIKALLTKSQAKKFFN